MLTAVQGWVSSAFTDGEETTTEAIGVTTDKSSVTQSKGGNSLTYPPELTSETFTSNFLVMRRLGLQAGTQYHSYTAFRNNFTTQQSTKDIFKPLSTINVYMPPLTENLQQNYGDQKVSLLAETIKTVQGVGRDFDTGDLGGSAKSVGNGALNVAGMMYGSGISSAASPFNDALTQTSGEVAVSPVAGAFTGPTRRNQTLTFIFAPKTKQELIIVANIIKELYRGALPSRGGALSIDGGGEFAGGANKFLTSYRVPDVWQLEEVSTSNLERYTPRFIFGPAAITSMRVNKTPDQYWQTFKATAGDPVQMEVEVSFTELMPMTRDMYENDLASSMNGYTGETNQ